MTDQIKIRMAKNHDVNLLSNIIRASHKDVAQKFHLTIDNCPKHPSNCSNGWIEKDLDRNVNYYILDQDKKSIGCIALEHANPDVCYIERLSVLYENRHNGFGKKLVDHAIDAAKALGVKEISIGIIAEFTELKKWYLKIGFIEGEIREFAHLPFRVLLMTYKLK